VVLAALGLYAVLAYSVERDRELGVRMALGAGKGRLRAKVLLEGLGLAVLGVAFGGVGARSASRFVATLLFLVVAGAASRVPAGRATRVNPVKVLKTD